MSDTADRLRTRAEAEAGLFCSHDNVYDCEVCGKLAITHIDLMAAALREGARLCEEAGPEELETFQKDAPFSVNAARFMRRICAAQLRALADELEGVIE